MKSGATAISSDMLFGRDPEPKQDKNQAAAGRWSTPASLSAIGEKIQDYLPSR